jgi:hypothetical protein
VITPWKGPLPRRRITPAPVLGEFLERAVIRTVSAGERRICCRSPRVR